MQRKKRLRIQPGMRIAVTAGSRGIRNVDEITRSVVAFVKSRDAEPFIVPAMGSHGGGTAEGQRELLRDSRGSPGAEMPEPDDHHQQRVYRGFYAEQIQF